MIRFRQKGDFSKLSSFLEKAKETIHIGTLDHFGREGIAALSVATPKDTGKTSESWEYRIHRTKDRVSLSFYNTNINDGAPIAIILQYGHLAKNGHWIEGIDYVNPAIKPIFEKIENEVWEEVTKV